MAKRKIPAENSAVLYQARYDGLRRRLAEVGWISEGYAQNRGPGAGGPCYQWTRKVKGKTISVALSKEQFEWLCLLYTSPSPRDGLLSRMPSSA